MCSSVVFMVGSAPVATPKSCLSAPLAFRRPAARSPQGLGKNSASLRKNPRQPHRGTPASRCGRRNHWHRRQAHRLQPASPEAAMNVRPSILCPIDFSEGSAGALRYAAAIASHFATRLILLSVEDPLLTEAADLGTGVHWDPEECKREMSEFAQ